MRVFKADLHIHSILSPCASLDMSPVNIVQKALEQKLDIIAITDHNSTRQCSIVMQEGNKKGLMVYPGVEITTREEIHCLALFATLTDIDKFQYYLDEYLPDVKNNTDIFGYQVVVDENEQITYEEERLLISALNLSIDKVEGLVHECNGIFIPAHTNKLKDSVISQLGFIPLTLKADAFEITKMTDRNTFISANRLPDNTTIIRNSDAHMIDHVGSCCTHFEMESADFEEFRLAIKHSNGRKVVLQ